MFVAFFYEKCRYSDMRALNQPHGCHETKPKMRNYPQRRQWRNILTPWKDRHACKRHHETLQPSKGTALKGDLIIFRCENSAVAERGENGGCWTGSIMLAGWKVAGYRKLLGTWLPGTPTQYPAFCGNFMVIWAVIAAQRSRARGGPTALSARFEMCFLLSGRPTCNHPLGQIQSSSRSTEPVKVHVGRLCQTAVTGSSASDASTLLFLTMILDLILPPRCGFVASSCIAKQTFSCHSLPFVYSNSICSSREPKIFSNTSKKSIRVSRL